MRVPILEARDLSWAPPGGTQCVPLFQDLCLELCAGERILLEGRSGSGKTTLLRCLVALEPLSGGELLWHGRPLRPRDVLQLRRSVVYLPQRPVAVAGRVAEELSFARRMATSQSEGAGGAGLEGRQEELLRRLDLGSLDRSRPFGELSQGEQQRVALVRCLSLAPEVLLLDEPTAALDPASQRLVEEVVVEHLEGAPGRRGLLWVSHAPDQAERLGGKRLRMEALAGREDGGAGS